MKKQTPAKPKGAVKADAAAKGQAAKGQTAKGQAATAAKSEAPAATKGRPAGSQKGYVPRLKAHYFGKIRPELMKRLGYGNIWQVPRLNKIVINMGLGNAREDANMLKGALDDMAVISGQKALVTYAKKPISNFKIRAKDPVGAKVTLRRDRMYEFLDRLLSLAVPRVRDFRGLSDRSFDGRGNYSMGVTEQIIFPEIDYDKIDKIRGLDVAITTSATTDEEGRALLEGFSFPFRQN